MTGRPKPVNRIGDQVKNGGCRMRQIHPDEQLIIWIEGQVIASQKERWAVRMLKRLYAWFLGVRYVESTG